MSAGELDPMVAAITRGVTFHEGVDARRLAFCTRLGMLVADPALGDEETRANGAMLAVGFRGSRLGNGTRGLDRLVPYYAARAAYPLPAHTAGADAGQLPEYSDEEFQDQLVRGGAHITLGNHATAALHPNNTKMGLNVDLWAVAVSHRVQAEHLRPSGLHVVMPPDETLSDGLGYEALARSASRTSWLGRLSLHRESTPVHDDLPTPFVGVVSYSDEQIGLPVIFMRQLGTVDIENTSRV